MKMSAFICMSTGELTAVFVQCLFISPAHFSTGWPNLQKLIIYFEHKLFVKYMLYQSARAAITEYHRLADLNNRNLFSYSSGR